MSSPSDRPIAVAHHGGPGWRGWGRGLLVTILTIGLGAGILTAPAATHATSYGTVGVGTPSAVANTQVTVETFVAHRERLRQRRAQLRQRVAQLKRQVRVRVRATARQPPQRVQQKQRQVRQTRAKLQRARVKLQRTRVKLRRTNAKLAQARKAQRARDRAPAGPEPIRQAGPVFGLSARDDAALTAAESRLGVTAGAVGVFADFRQDFPMRDAERAAERGAVLVVAWEPHDMYAGTPIQPDFELRDILAGHHDQTIRAFARDAARSPVPVWVRFAPEMNGDWHAWSPGVNGNQVAEFARAWRHVVDTVRAAAGDANIRWMFNPIVSWPGATAMVDLWPGNEYVDWVGLDGYNWGNLKWGWQSFDDIFTFGLAELRQVAPDLPLAIPEVATTGGPQAADWIADTMDRARAEGVRLLVWFEHDKETDWRLSVRSDTRSALLDALSRGTWLTGGNLRSTATALQ